MSFFIRKIPVSTCIDPMFSDAHNLALGIFRRLEIKLDELTFIIIPYSKVFKMSDKNMT